MKRSMASLVVLGLFWAGTAQAKEMSVLDEVMANKRNEVQDIQKLIGSQFQLVGSYKLSKGQRQLKSSEELFSGVTASYDFGDINLDGRKDLAVAVENAQGRRSLQIYLGDTDGSMKLFREGTKVLLRSDVKTESDSFNSVQISSKNRSISVSHIDDISMRWNRIQKFQFQNDEIVLVAQRLVSTGSFGTKVEDQNFLKGEQTVKTLKSEDGPSTVFKSQLPKSAGLTKLQDASVTKY